MRRRIIEILFDFCKQNHSSNTYWLDQERGIFREKIQYKRTKLDMIVQDYGTHTGVVAGLLSLTEVPSSTRECILRFFFSRSDNDRVITFALNEAETRILMRGYLFNNSDYEDALNNFVQIRDEMLRDIDNLDSTLQEIIETCE